MLFSNSLVFYPRRCRVDFDTSVGDETYSILKTSTEFMQNFVSACCYAMIPGLQEERQAEMMRVVQAKAELKALEDDGEEIEEAKLAQLRQVVSRSGREEGYKWNGPLCRVYFPDEGNAALARRDWLNSDAPKVPACVQFSSCGGIQTEGVQKDRLVFFFCPKASEAEDVEKIVSRNMMVVGCCFLAVATFISDTVSSCKNPRRKRRTCRWFVLSTQI